jgi:hypothetical protein
MGRRLGTRSADEMAYLREENAMTRFALVFALLITPLSAAHAEPQGALIGGLGGGLVGGAVGFRLGAATGPKGGILSSLDSAVTGGLVGLGAGALAGGAVGDAATEGQGTDVSPGAGLLLGGSIGLVGGLLVNGVFNALTRKHLSHDTRVGLSFVLVPAAVVAGAAIGGQLAENR